MGSLSGSIYFFFRRHTIVSGSRPLPGLMSPRCSIALMVLRLADRGRISSSSFNRRRIGLPPSVSIGEVRPSSEGITIVTNGAEEPLTPPVRDEIARAFEGR
jgi:hypothetical protein